MKKKKVFWIFIFIIALAFFAVNLSYPNYFNQAVGTINNRFGLNLPRFWDIPFKLGLDLQGGTHLIYDADLSGVDKADYSTAMQGLRDVIERRINVFGIQEPMVQTQESGNNYRLVVELAGIKDPAEAIKMIGQTPFLEFKEERAQEETQKILDKIKEIKDNNLTTVEEVQKLPDWQLAFEDPYFKATELNGKYLKKANLDFDQTTSKPLISLQFNDDGAKVFEDLTARNVGKRLAIYIDDVQLSAPVVQDKITGGKAQITGSFTITSAKELVRNLNAGALPVPIKLVSQQNVGPVLGAASLQKSLVAGMYGFLAVIIFMVLFYRLPGVLAALALGIYIALILSIFKLLSVTLTLAGIGGFVLSIGMAVDANILIFSRMREELKEGKGFSGALEEGFRRSWPAIRDGHFTALLIAVILFSFGTSFVKGFAFTWGIGILVNLFTSIVITRTFLRIFEGTRIEKWKWLY